MTRRSQNMTAGNSTMRDGICPKCGSEEVYMSEASGHAGVIYLDTSTTGAVTIYDYVCTDCGCVEQYILSNGALKQIRQQWRRVKPEKRKNDENIDSGEKGNS